MQKSFARRSYVRSKPTTCTILQLYFKQSLHLGSTMKAMERGNNKKNHITCQGFGQAELGYCVLVLGISKVSILPQLPCFRSGQQ